jgi:flavin-dependent dehydrogenase
LALASDLFEIDIATLQIGPMVERRHVAWSAGEPSMVPQIALACDVGELAATLANQLQNVECVLGKAENNDAGWIIEAFGRPDYSASGGQPVGQFARIANVKFEAMTSITATSRGWIFTAPHPEGGLAVLMVAPSVADTALTADDVAERFALAGRRVSAADIIAIDRPEPIAPRLSECLIVENRVRIGDAALTIDPLRGDGVGFALRGVLLAQAVLTAIDSGQERTPLCSHYDKRLRSVFVSHLKTCSAYYRAARHATIWHSNVAAMDDLVARLDVREEAFQSLPLPRRQLAPPSASSSRASLSATR